MSRAQTQQTRRSQTADRADWQAGQIEAAQARATYRRAQRDLQYGTETEKPPRWNGSRLIKPSKKPNRRLLKNQQRRPSESTANFIARPQSSLC